MKQVSIYILYDNNCVLLMRRTADAPIDPNHWGFFGGKIEKGETPKVAVQREAQEELELKLDNIKLFKSYKQEDQYGKQLRHIFIGPLTHSIDILKLQQKEGVDLGLFSLEELKNIKITENDFSILKEVLKHISKK